MSEKNSDKKIVLLTRAVTFKGVDYAPGRNEMPADAAERAVNRNFGAYEKADPKSPDFKPLPFEETNQRFFEGDESEEIFDSLRYYQSKIKLAKEVGLSLEEYLEKEAEQNADGGKNQSSSNAQNKSETGNKENTGEKDGDVLSLSEDLPMRHVFASMGEKYDSDDKIRTLTREELIGLPGIAAASADKILAYFAQKK